LAIAHSKKMLWSFATRTISQKQDEIKALQESDFQHLFVCVGDIAYSLEGRMPTLLFESILHFFHCGLRLWSSSVRPRLVIVSLEIVLLVRLEFLQAWVAPLSSTS
jgi:hypothetical protein